MPTNPRMFRSNDLTLWARKYHRYTRAGMPMVTTTRAEPLATPFFPTTLPPSRLKAKPGLATCSRKPLRSPGISPSHNRNNRTTCCADRISTRAGFRGWHFRLLPLALGAPEAWRPRQTKSMLTRTRITTLTRVKAGASSCASSPLRRQRLAVERCACQVLQRYRHGARFRVNIHLAKKLQACYRRSILLLRRLLIDNLHAKCAVRLVGTETA